MASDPGAVDAAILAALAADGPLMALCGGAVFFGVAKQGFDVFLLVDRLSHADDQNCFGAAAGEAFVYLVKAVRPGTATGDARAAALRIRELLEGNETLAIDGYALQDPITELEAVRILEVDEVNPDRQVQHWGGHYALQVQRLEGTRTRRSDHALSRQTRGSIDRGDAGRVAQQVDAQRGDG
jgi:hypothetical protein